MVDDKRVSVGNKLAVIARAPSVASGAEADGRRRVVKDPRSSVAYRAGELRADARTVELEGSAFGGRGTGPSCTGVIAQVISSTMTRAIVVRNKPQDALNPLAGTQLRERERRREPLAQVNATINDGRAVPQARAIARGACAGDEVFVAGGDFSSPRFDKTFSTVATTLK